MFRDSSDIAAYLAEHPFVLAPMVDHSDLPFRMLTRQFGTGLCFTPMIHARLYAEDASYRQKIFRTAAGDRPLVVQIAGDDPEVLLKAALLLQPHCDIIDLNLGCPQGIAKRGNYGSYLLEQEELVLKIVRHLSANLTVPFSCKIRLFQDLERTYKLVKQMEAEGCRMLTVHGRTREQNKDQVGSADLGAIAKIKTLVGIPVIANGNVANHGDLLRILAETKCDGVMSAEAVLEYPALFSPLNQLGILDMDQLVAAYLDATDTFEDQEHFIKSHLFKMLFTAFKSHPDLRDKLTLAKTQTEYKEVASEVRERRKNVPPADKLGWYFRYQKVTMHGLPKQPVPESELAVRRSLESPTPNPGESNSSEKRIKET